MQHNFLNIPGTAVEFRVWILGANWDEEPGQPPKDGKEMFGIGKQELERRLAKAEGDSFRTRLLRPIVYGRGCRLVSWKDIARHLEIL